MEILHSDPPAPEVTNWYPLGQHLQFFHNQVPSHQELHIPEGSGADVF